MSEVLHQEVNPFPVWTFESRVLTHKWANTNIAVIFSYTPASEKRINYVEVANQMEKNELKRKRKELEEMDTPF
jgi:hypothetical protein